MFPFSSGQKFADVHDPIYARALVLGNGSAKVAFIAVEVTTLPGSDELVKAVTTELGIPPEHLIMDATHDHNAPGGGQSVNVQSPYFALLKKDIVQAAHEANANLQPARIGFGRGLAYVNTNRDEKIGVGYHMGYSPDGPSDKTVAVVEVTNAAGDPIEIYANYAVHGVVMFRTHTGEDGAIEVTGDLPGWTSNYVEDRLGKNVVALWTSGAAGDQNPLFQGDYNQDAPDVHDEGSGAWALLDVQSRRLGEEVVRVAKNIQDTSDHAVLWGASTSVTCPGQVRAVPPTPGVPGGGYRAPDPATVKMKDADPVNIPLTLLMVNDIAFAGVSGEVFTEIGEHLKQQSLFDHTLMVTLLPNDFGYIPTDKAYLLPSEKAVGNKLKPGCAEPAMINGFKQMEAQYIPVWKAAD
ncbi:MAG: hypothetical protein ACREJM_02305, partial [Candidatus Saccharimonadales bacterium]